MVRRFVIGADNLSAAHEKEIKSYLGGLGGYWHWIENFWLFTYRGDSAISASTIRDKIGSLNADSRCVVLEVGADVDWSARGKPNSKGGRHSDWLQETWADDPPDEAEA